MTEVWSVPYTGVVVNGIINSGTITAGDAVLIGPDSVGGWINTTVKSIHRKRAPVPSAEMKKGVVRKGTVPRDLEAYGTITYILLGMVVISKTETPPKVVKKFEGQVLIL